MIQKGFKMAKTRVYIDGQAGTTGLQIFDRIGSREDLELMRIDEDKRHDNEERRKFLNAADIVFLCLPDDGAREAVSLIDNPDVRVIDASTAHRTNDDWTYPTVIPSYPQSSATRLPKAKELPTPAVTQPALFPVRRRWSAWELSRRITLSPAFL